MASAKLLTEHRPTPRTAQPISRRPAKASRSSLLPAMVARRPVTRGAILPRTALESVVLPRLLTTCPWAAPNLPSTILIMTTIVQPTPTRTGPRCPICPRTPGITPAPAGGLRQIGLTLVLGLTATAPIGTMHSLSLGTRLLAAAARAAAQRESRKNLVSWVERARDGRNRPGKRWSEIPKTGCAISQMYRSLPEAVGCGLIIPAWAIQSALPDLVASPASPHRICGLRATVHRSRPQSWPDFKPW